MTRQVLECTKCGAGFLVGDDVVDYESTTYRQLVDGTNSTIESFERHDPDQAGKIALIGTEGLRGITVADIGCGTGSFLDLLAGMAGRTIAVEPAEHFRVALRERGHSTYAYAHEAAGEWSTAVDLAVCFSVIEHLEYPREELEAIRSLLKRGGTLVVSTPNLDDWLLEVAGETYAPFFYRVVHRWYFTARSLEALLRAAGYRDVRIRYVHRFDLANALVWLRDGRPAGRGAIRVSPSVDAAYRAWLEADGRADYVYAWATA